MDRAEIRTKVVDIIAEQLGINVEDINDDMTFTEDLDADSLDTVEMVMQFEEAFDMEIDDDDAAELAGVSIKAILDFIEKKL